MSWNESQERERRLRKLENKTWHSYGAGAYYDIYKDRIIRYSCHNSWLKKHCRRVTRRRMRQGKAYHQKGCSYKKYYDYWWILL